jgi:hypothetical protein
MSEYTAPPPPPSQPSGWGSGPAGPDGPAGPGGPGGSGGPGGPTPPAKGFFGALFDFSFEHFVTPSIVKVVYVLATIALALGFVVFLISALISGSSGLIVLTLILGPVLAVLYLALIRMTLEFYFAIVRMSEDIHRGERV